MTEKSRCPHCGAAMGGRWERLTPGLVKTLVKFKQAVIDAQKNDINPSRLGTLSHSEKANFQKLRFHALVAKVREDGEHLEGRWLLTHRGSQFLLGNTSVPRRVFVFRNEVKDHDTDSVNVADVMRAHGGAPRFDGKFDFEYEPMAGSEKQVEFLV